MENDLRRALERDELTLDYQPQVSLSDRSILGVEALLRWEHPTRGRIAPGDFISVAEENGLIDPIGRAGSWTEPAARRRTGIARGPMRLRSRCRSICTELQVTELTRLGCDIAQGYHFSRPLPPAEITRMLQGGPAWLGPGA